MKLEYIQMDDVDRLEKKIRKFKVNNVHYWTLPCMICISQYQ